MSVWVVMGNDYPDAVFKTEESAERYCEEKRQEESKRRGGYTVIYWRA